MKTRAALFLLFLLSAGRGASAVPADVRFEQRIGRLLPLDAVFTDEGGRAVPLSSFFGGKPVVLFFNYFRCPELCTLVAGGAVDTLRQVRASIGRDYAVISVSIDPTDTPEMARAQQHEDVLHYGRTGASAGWHTLTGTPGAIRAVAEAAGFHFSYDPRSRQYAHPSGVIVVTPRGIVSSYFLGVDFPAPAMALALRRAAGNRTGNSVFNLLFLCFQGGSPEGQYGRLIWIVLCVSVALTVVIVFGGIAWMLRSERAAHSGTKGAA